MNIISKFSTILLVVFVLNQHFVFPQAIDIKAKKGVIKLTDKSYAQCIFNISGEVPFYAEKFVQPTKINDIETYQELDIKHSWNNQKPPHQKYPAKFYGTYHFKIIIDEKYVGESFILRPNHFISYASEIFVNAKPVCNNGKVGKNETDKNYSASRKTEWKAFRADTTVLDVVIWTANFSHFRGGIFNTISFGLSENMIVQREKAVAVDLIVIISLLLMFLYHIIIFFVNTNERVTLFFSITCLIFAFDFSLQDTMIFFIFFPDVSFDVSSFIHNILPYMLPSSFVYFLYSLFPHDVSRKIRNTTGIVTISLIFFTIIDTQTLSIYVFKPHYAYALLIVLYIYYIAIKAVVNKRPDAKFFLIAYLIFSAGAINDILLMFEVINSVSMVAAGLLVFVFMLSVMQGQKSLNLYKRNLKLTKEVLKTNIGLEKEIAKRTEELNASLKKVKEYSKFKEDMTNMLTHELKVPLNVIVNPYYIKDKQLRVEHMQQAGYKILNLLQNILDVYKYENTEISLQISQFDIAGVLKNCINELSPFIKQKSLSIRLISNKNYLINADKKQINRVIINLLSNAIKFSPSNETITIDFALTNHKSLKIVISNQGAGIPKEKQEDIFLKFRQHEKRPFGKSASSGLGLTFCKMIVEAHKGEIGVISEIEKGASFWFTIPHASKTDGVKPIEIYDNTDENLTLKPDDTAYLKPFCAKLTTLEIFEISEIMTLLKTIEAKNPSIKNWKERVKQAVYANNEKKFKELVGE